MPRRRGSESCHLEERGVANERGVRGDLVDLQLHLAVAVGRPLVDQDLPSAGVAEHPDRYVRLAAGVAHVGGDVELARGIEKPEQELEPLVVDVGPLWKRFACVRQHQEMGRAPVNDLQRSRLAVKLVVDGRDDAKAAATSATDGIPEIVESDGVAAFGPAPFALVGQVACVTESGHLGRLRIQLVVLRRVPSGGSEAHEAAVRQDHLEMQDLVDANPILFHAERSRQAAAEQPTARQGDGAGRATHEV
mmetsp:Transcript_138903/g.387375  ORF Transcript_138903/g.387375 Transcript_138903/m.387375 type:complete len:249 (-) Transcript_138903:863-1609(-)